MKPEMAGKLAKRLVQRWITLIEGDLTSDGFWECVATELGLDDLSSLTAEQTKDATTILRAAQSWLLLGVYFISKLDRGPKEPPR